MNFEPILSELKKEHDLIGLWQIVRYVKDESTFLPEAELRVACLRLVSLMLSEGFEAGSPPYSIGGYAKWQDQRPDSVLQRIEQEWQLLERYPEIADIVWFKPPNLNN